MLLGLIVIIFQPGILGFPSDWNLGRYVLIVAGLLIIAVAYGIKPDSRKVYGDETLPYSEHRQGTASSASVAPAEPAKPTTDSVPQTHSDTVAS